MVCNKCHVQMFQHEKIGGGESTDNAYITWELKECPTCGRYVKESYCARVLSKSEVKRLKFKTN